MRLHWVKHKEVLFNKTPFTWSQFIPIYDKPIQYLEIGVLHGVNTVHISQTYCKHIDSQIHCVDPWEDYTEYIEYKGQQSQNYNNFIWNITNTGTPEKFVIHRGYSETIVPTFEDNFFDLVFIDGNHETEYVYKDGVMSLSKTKPGGYIVFDDYDWAETKKGILMFLQDYTDKIKILGDTRFQLFIQKI